ncbi:hypothetical protein GCM10007276_12900 [Agaricicola taiwanensis]|uniref:Lipoprotein n=1 Tax=Agaricicola taiwanensis TaxID=591372 RepID=A0A8J2VRZ2_9RHOB|nr:hypothetical protein [Agaricicola taiwanensis]GGE36867.1 hypothetical protein GCM10007276_12900 [Agaricicola taiwanensis]
MRHGTSAFIVVGLLLAGGTACTQTNSSVAPREGMMCEVPDENLWWGRFSGGREISSSFDSDSLERYTEERCFTTRAQCQRWLYDLKSAYGFAPEWNECRRGYQPGVPVKPWYAPGQ